MFIGCSGTNRSAFYLYMATSAGLSATLSYAQAQAWKRCGLYTAMSVPYSKVWKFGCQHRHNSSRNTSDFCSRNLAELTIRMIILSKIRLDDFLESAAGITLAYIYTDKI